MFSCIAGRGWNGVQTWMRSRAPDHYHWAADLEGSALFTVKPGRFLCAWLSIPFTSSELSVASGTQRSSAPVRRDGSGPASGPDANVRLADWRLRTRGFANETCFAGASWLRLNIGQPANQACHFVDACSQQLKGMSARS